MDELECTDPLRATWSKRERDVMIHYPRSCDGHWLSGVFDKAFTDELEKRGYDVTTLRFSVQRKARAALAKAAAS